MNSAKFADARVLVMDPQAHMRSLTREALMTIGFRGIESSSNFADVRRKVMAEAHDLLILDVDSAPDEACTAITDIRNGHIASDPFMVVIATSWEPKAALVRSVMQAGPDDLVAKPLSAGLLKERVHNLVQNRKDFIVTSTYLGPDRRSHTRPPNEDDLPPIAVPNSLRSKVTGAPMTRQAMRSVQAAMQDLKLHKIICLAQDVAHTVDLVRRDAYAEDDPLANTDGLLTLEPLLQDIDRMLHEMRMGQLREIVGSALSILHALLLNPGQRNPRQLEVLRLHAVSIATAVREQGSAAEPLSSALRRATAKVAG